MYAAVYELKGDLLRSKQRKLQTVLIKSQSEAVNASECDSERAADPLHPYRQAPQVKLFQPALRVAHRPGASAPLPEATET